MLACQVQSGQVFGIHAFFGISLLAQSLLIFHFVFASLRCVLYRSSSSVNITVVLPLVWIFLVSLWYYMGIKKN